MIGISLLFIPISANADEILIELTPEVAYVDTVVEVTGPTEYFIETFTGTRLEQQANGTVRVRDGWVDSWIELRQGETVLRADDDSNHLNGVNEYASKLTGTVNTGTYTIRATSYLNRIGYGNPTGNYTLTSNLIQVPPPPLVVEPEPIPEPTVPTEPAVVPPVAPLVPQEPVAPPIIPFEPPIEVPTVEEPSVPAEEPPVVIEEPTLPVEEPPIEAEEPPMVEEEAPIPVEEPPAEAEESPAEEEPEVVQVDEVDLETLAPDTPVQLDNGVVLEAGTVVALQLLENPAELLSEIFNDPGQVLTALSNIGADMSEEEREESEKIIIASVIAGQAAVNAATMAAGTTTRTPSAPSAPAGGPMSGNDKPRASRRRES